MKHDDDDQPIATAPQMPTFDYAFEIEERVIKRCYITVQAESLQAAMDDVSVNGVWEWAIQYGKDLDYQAEELDVDPQDPKNWKTA